MSKKREKLEAVNQALEQYKNNFVMVDGQPTQEYAEGKSKETRDRDRAAWVMAQEDYDDLVQSENDFAAQAPDARPSVDLVIEQSRGEMSRDQATEVSLLKARSLRNAMIAATGAPLPQAAFSKNEEKMILKLPPRIRIGFTGPIGGGFREAMIAGASPMIMADAVTSGTTAQTAGGTLGNILVPDTTEANIFRVVEVNSQFYNLARKNRYNTGEIHWHRTKAAANGALYKMAGPGVAPDRRDMRDFARKDITIEYHTPGRIDISWDTLMDSDINLEAEVSGEFGSIVASGIERLSAVQVAGDSIKALESDLDTTSRQLVAADATAQVTAITKKSLLALKALVNRAYPDTSLRWMFNKNTETELRDILDFQLRSTDQSAAGAPLQEHLFGIQYIRNDSLPDMAAGKIALFLGDFSGYYFDMAGGFQIYVDGTSTDSLTSRSSVFIGYHRIGGRLIEADKVTSFKNAAA